MIYCNTLTRLKFVPYLLCFGYIFTKSFIIDQDFWGFFSPLPVVFSTFS